jgi:hypothetical protein
MATDLGLVGYRYNIILSIFFIVYLRFVLSSSPVALNSDCRLAMVNPFAC